MGSTVLIDVMREHDLRTVASIDPTTPMVEEHLREELRRPWARLWVAREDDEPVAFLATWHVADELHVLNVATRADRRRRGIARALLEELLTYARSHGVRKVLLEVRRLNREAIALYRAVGFFAMGLRARYYPDDEDAVEMVLELNPETGNVVRGPDQVRLES